MATQVQGRKGQTLLEAMRPVFQNAEAPCSGRGRCGRCRVLVRAENGVGPSGGALLSAVGDEEARLLGADYLEAGWRLSCLAQFIQDGALRIHQEERTFFLPDSPARGRIVPAPDVGLCAAVDIGTTTITCVLAESVGEDIVGRIAAVNRQRSYGYDVVSRIESVLQRPEHLAAMQSLVHDQVGYLLDELCRRAGAQPPERIHICGNTTMLHFWEGADISGLGSMPFRPAFVESRPSALKLAAAPVHPCRLLPGISAFIGSDILAGILACGLQNAPASPELLIDIGTSCEIVLAASGRLWATATAAGPAFEGVTISCGLPAVNGAVDHVVWGDGRFSFTTLGGLPAAGFCGSGLLDLLACLRRAGLLDEHGGLIIPADEKGERTFVLSSNTSLRFTQADVRQMQLAKGAISAGVRILCRCAGIAPVEIGRVHLAGSFGSSLSPESAAMVGLIPSGLTGRVKAEGNTALAGALMSARDPDLLDVCDRIRTEIRVVDLANEAGFQDAFVEAMRFPSLPLED